jgi:hypothetical protein
VEDDLEPIDLEPIDLEPVDLEPEYAPHIRHARERRPAWIWVGLLGAGLAAWAVIALTTGGGNARPAPATPTSAPLADRLTALTARLHTGLRGLGTGRFAAVIDERLYLVDEARPEASLVGLPGSDVAITNQSGASLSVSSFDETIVFTQPISTRTLPAREVAIPAVAPGRWWIFRDDGTIRPDDTNESERVPEGLRVVAAVPEGFLALDRRSAWVVWSGATVRPIGRLGAQLLATGPRTVAFKNHCAYNGCELEILDVARGTGTTIPLSKVPEFAAFSPDGSLLAIATTLADVYVIDAKTGAHLAQTQSRYSLSPSLPFTWTADGRALLVVHDREVEVMPVSTDLAPSFIAGTDGLKQLIALP